MGLVILGGGRHALVVRDCLNANPFDLIGILDDRLETGSLVEDIPILGPVSSLPDLMLRHPALCGVIAIGDNHARRCVADRVEAIVPGFVWTAAVHPSAIVSPAARIATGAVIVAGVIINCHATIGAHALINTGSIIDHDTRVGAFASTGPGVVTGGNVSIGTGSHIGLGAALSHGVSVGEHAVVGGGALVCRDIPARTVSYGVPARVIRHRNVGDRYL